MNPHHLSSLIPLVASLIIVSCAGPGGESKASSVPPAPTPGTQEGVDSPPEVPAPPTRVLPTPWTDAFLGRALVLADRITVEGPAGLVEHCVMTLDDALFERTERPTADGLEWVLRPRGSGGGQELLRAQIDAWNLVAYKEIRMDLRAGLKEVIVTAEGDALWKDTDGTEQRGARLLFRGQVKEGSFPLGSKTPK